MRRQTFYSARLAALASLLALAAGCAPAATTSAPTRVPPPTQPPVTSTAAILTTPTAPAATIAAPTPAPEFETRILEVEWPPVIRVGDTDSLRLSFRPAVVHGVATVQVTVEDPGHTAVQHEVTIPNLFETHTVRAQPRLTAVGLQVSPQQPEPKTLQPGEAADWRWIIQPQQAADYTVLLSLHLDFTPRVAGQGEALERDFDTPPFKIRGVRMFGMTGAQLDAMSLIGMVATAVTSVAAAWEKIKAVLGELFKPAARQPKGGKRKR